MVGAGGHFCPVAKLTGAKPARENAVVAQEAEFEMDDAATGGVPRSPEMPELYFCADIKGYGWCFRKNNYLNIGLGRMDQHRLSEHVAAFVRFLEIGGSDFVRCSVGAAGPRLSAVWSLRAQAGRRRRVADRGRGGLGL